MNVECGYTRAFKQIAQAMDLGRSRQEHQHVAVGIAQDPLHLCSQWLHLARREIALLGQQGQRLAKVADSNRKHAALCFHHRCIAEPHCHRRRIDGGRHHQQAQWQVQGFLRFPAQRQAQVRVQAALVEFIEDHGRHAGKRDICCSIRVRMPSGHYL